MTYIYIIVFSLVFSIVLNIVYFKKNHLDTRETRYYSILLIINFIGLLAEMLCTIVGNTFPVNTIVPHICTKLFMCYLTGFTVIMSLYIYSLCLVDKEALFNKIKKISVYFLVLSVLIFFIYRLILLRGMLLVGLVIMFIMLVRLLLRLVFFLLCFQERKLI